MDALSAAFRSVRITGAVFFNAEFSAPWGSKAPHARDIQTEVAPDTEHMVPFHLVTAGRLNARVAGAEAITVSAGEIVVFPHGDAHELWNGPVGKLIDAAALIPKILAGEFQLEQAGGGGERTTLICGYFGCERYAQRLFLAGLPAIFKVDIRGDTAGAWIGSTLQHLVAETELRRPGGTALISKLSEALFIQTLCRYAETQPEEKSGWLAAARDPVAGRALACFHKNPERDWTLPTLAKEIGASRSVLADRFVRLIGQPPLEYLAQWRLQFGARLLATTDDTVLRVAMNVGYDSEAAFNRAFKREFGDPPGRYRRRLRVTPPSTCADRVTP